MSTNTGEQAADVAYDFLVILHRHGSTRAQAIDSLHSVANELVEPLITPTPAPAQRRALDCVDTLRAAATVLADHDRGPRRWTPNEVQYEHATTDSAESSTVAAAPPTPPTDAPPPPPPCPPGPPGLDESEYVRARHSEYVRARLATQYPMPASERRT